MFSWKMQFVIGVSMSLSLGGCANVRVEKVDLQERIAGTDDCVKGFRYYMTRPYLVVASRVSLSKNYIPVWVGVLKEEKPASSQGGPTVQTLYLVAAIPDQHGKYLVYDQAGRCTPYLAEQVTILKGQAIPVKQDQGGPQKTIKLTDLEQALGKSLGKYFITPTSEVVKITLRGKMNEVIELPGPISTKVVQYLTEKNYLAAAQTAIHGITEGPTKTDGAFTVGNKYLNGLTPPLSLPADAEGKMVDDISKELTQIAAQSTSGSEAPQGAALAGANSSKGGTLKTSDTASDSSKASSDTPASTPNPDPGPFQVIFLPDFEEQYAIRNINIMAKTKYRYTFRNGTDLETVSGSYNATDVPLKIVETVGTLITALGEVAKTRMGAIPGGAAAKASLTVSGLVETPFYIRIDQSIEPGVYRVQKSWERVAGTPLTGLPMDQLCGLFSDVGLPVTPSVSVIDAATHKAETEKPSVPPATPK